MEKLLLIDGDDASAAAQEAALAESVKGEPWYELIRARKLREAIDWLQENQAGAVLADLKTVAASHGFTMKDLRKAAGDAPVIALSDIADTLVSIRAVRQGAEECLVKGQLRGRPLANLIRVTIERHKITTQSAVQLEVRERGLKRLLTVDELTGLMNDRSFVERLHQEMLRAERFKTALAVMAISIRDMGHLADTYGPAFAEQTEVVVAKLLQGVLRRIDIPGRLARGQYGIILFENPLAGGQILAQRIQKMIEGSPLAAPVGKPIQLRCDIGMAAHEADLKEPVPLIRRAFELIRGGETNRASVIRVWEWKPAVQ